MLHFPPSYKANFMPDQDVSESINFGLNFAPEIVSRSVGNACYKEIYMSDFNDGGDPNPTTNRRERNAERSDAAMGWWWMWLCFFALFLFAGFGWWGWNNPANKPVVTNPSIPATFNAARNNGLIQKIGQNVTLHGNVVSVAGPHAFVLHNNGADAIGATDVLIITRQPISNATTAASDRRVQRPKRSGTQSRSDQRDGRG